VSGTPTTAGSYPLTIRATAEAGGYEYSGFLDFILVVADPAAAFTSGPPPGGVVDTPYSFAFVAGGDSGIAFSLSGGNLPPGLSLASDGVLSGTPTTAGTYAFVVTATGAGSSAEQNATITIAPKPAPTNPTPTGPALAATGPDATAYAIAGVVLIIAGLVLVGFIRRRRAASSA
jgi:LPXTG-motif cell wall-anchored protein